MQQPALQNVDL